MDAARRGGWTSRLLDVVAAAAAESTPCDVISAHHTSTPARQLAIATAARIRRKYSYRAADAIYTISSMTEAGQLIYKC